MIETPLFGRFQGENKRLVFSAPAPYHALIRGSMITGGVMMLFGLAVPGLDGGGLGAGWWIVVGFLVAMAGVVASFSLTSISFDLIERRYRRRQGPGVFKKLTPGSMAELDALVLISEPNSRFIAGGVTYHLVLHWKGEAQPLMVLQQDTRILTPGQPMNSAAGLLLNAGANYARFMGVPFYDNSHLASKCPVPIWK